MKREVKRPEYQGGEVRSKIQGQLRQSTRARVFGFNHVLGRLEMRGDRLEFENYVHRPKLSVLVEEIFGL